MDVTVLVLSGRQGSGKDSVAEYLKATKKYKQVSLAGPIYKVLNLSTKSHNGDKISTYELYDLSLSLLGGPATAPPFDVVSKLTTKSIPYIYDQTGSHDIVGRSGKPREFLQKMGDLFRSFDEDIFVNYLADQIMKDTRRSVDSYLDMLERVEAGTEVNIEAGLNDSDEDDTPVSINRVEPLSLAYVVSDMRLPNEQAGIMNIPDKIRNFVRPDINTRVIFVKLNIDEDTAIDRVLGRDSLPIESIQKANSHKTESSLDEMAYDYEIDATQPLEDVLKEINRILVDESEYDLPGLDDEEDEDILDDLSAYSKGKE